MRILLSKSNHIANSNTNNNYYNNKKDDQDWVFVNMSSVGSSSGVLPYFVPAGPTSSGGVGGRSRLNLCRSWNSLSRFQRSILSLILLLCVLSSAVVMFFHRDLQMRARLTSSVSRKSAPSQQFLQPSNHDPISNNKAPWKMSAKLSRDEGVPGDIRRDDKFLTNNRPEGEGQEEGGQPPGQINEPKVLKFEGPENERQQAVVDAFKYAWKAYKKHAWGKDQLRPVSKGQQEWFGLGLTILDSLDTIIIMGLQEEYEEARDWVEKHLNFEKRTYVSLFETTIRCLGGLLSAFHLTGDKMFLDKAKDLGYRLAGAFNTPSKIPYSDINLATKSGKQPSWGQDSSLAEFTSVQLEFRDLSRQTGISYFEEVAFNASKHVHAKGCLGGLCPMFMSPKTGNWREGGTITFGARSDSYYEYLLKQWLQTGKTIDWLKRDYDDAMKSMNERLVRYSDPNKLTFVGELIGGKTYYAKMDHLTCFISGTLALGHLNGFPESHKDLAKAIGHTCHQFYKNPTGLGPEIAHFNMVPTPNKQDIYVKPLDAHCLLRPEAIEAWFYLYRIYGNKQYQDWGWEAFQAIEKYAKIPGGSGYSSIQNVKKIPVQRRDLMESFFLAETLKYLYLLFSDSQKDIPLDKYVFNTEAHPLPIYSS